MGTHSFYLPQDEEARITRKLRKCAQERGASVSKLITEVIRKFVDAGPSGGRKTPGWAAKFLGCWKGGDAVDVISLIEASRTRQKNPSFK